MLLMRRVVRRAAGLLVILVCSGGLSGAPASAQTASAGRDLLSDPGAPEGGTVLFLRVNTGIGLNATFTKGNTHTGGGCWIDYNNDYLPDLFLTNGSGFGHFFYRNNGDGTFTNVSSLLPKPNLALEEAGAAFGDIDNDGDEDLLVAVDNPFLSLDLFNPIEGGPNLLYLNQGNGTFVEAGVGSGFDDPLGRRNIQVSLADFDRDGVLDAFVGHWQVNNPEGMTSWDRLLVGNGNGTFTDVTAERRVDGYGRDTLTSLWFDADFDNWPDLIVGTIGGSQYVEPDNNDILYRNQGPGEFFCDVTGDPHVLGNDAKAAMGIDVGDIDNDGDWDMYITDIFDTPGPPLGNVLYEGNPDGTFSDNSCDVAGVCAFNSWPCGFADIDRDGWVDLWVGSGASTSIDYMFMNDQDGTFTNANDPAFIGNTARGGAQADYDGDGDVDFFLWNWNGNSVVYRNFTITTNRWIEFKLSGTTSNRSAIGALVKVTANGMTQMRRVSGGDSAHSQSELAVHFGVGTATAVDVSILWPSGQEDAFAAVPTNEFHLVDEDLGLLPESLRIASVVHDAASQRLVVDVTTNYVGRSVLEVTGFGPLAYDVARLGHGRHFTGVATRPAAVTVTSAKGSSWTLPVTAGR